MTFYKMLSIMSIANNHGIYNIFIYNIVDFHFMNQECYTWILEKKTYQIVNGFSVKLAHL